MTTHSTLSFIVASVKSILIARTINGTRPKYLIIIPRKSGIAQSLVTAAWVSRVKKYRDRTFGLPELLSFQEVLLNLWTGHKPQIRVLLQMWLWGAHVLILGCKQLSYILIPGVLLELNHILSLEGHLSVATHPRLIQLLWVSYHIKLHVQCFEH